MKINPKNSFNKMLIALTKLLVGFAFDVFALGFVYHKLYDWLAVPIGFPPLRWVQLYGIVFLFTVFLEQPQTEADVKLRGHQFSAFNIQEGFVERKLFIAAIHYVFLFMGYLLTFFI